MKVPYKDQWQPAIAALQAILSDLPLTEERKWGKPCYTHDGKNIVIIQPFKEYLGLGFFQGALLADPKKRLEQLGQVQAARVLKLTGADDVAAQASTIVTYVRAAIAVAKSGRKVEKKTTADYPVPDELRAKLRQDARFKKAFEALTPGRQRGYLHHFAGAKQSATRAARIEKAMPAIFAGRGFLERPPK